MSLQQIKVSKSEVLKIVKDNKVKHDTILKDAVEGYWINAESHLKKNEKEQLDKLNKNHREQLKALRKARKEAIKTLKSNTAADLDLVKSKDKSKGFRYWNGKYPEDHGDEYEGTIRRLELSVSPEVELDTEEFDSYIRNKWQWRDSFLVSNSNYVTSYRTTPNYAATASYTLGNVGISCLNSTGSLKMDF